MSNITFTPGVFQTFRATRKFHLGKYGVDILDTVPFDYDGVTIRFQGREYEEAGLQGAVGLWFVPVADTTSTYKSRSANVQVRAATPESQDRGQAFSMGEASEEEAVVGTMERSAEVRKAAGDNNQQRLAELRNQRRQIQQQIDEGDSNPNAPPPVNAGDADAEVEAVFMESAKQTYIKARPLREQAASLPASQDEIEALVEADRRNRAAIAAATAQLQRVDPHKTRDEMGGTRFDTTDKAKKTAGKYNLVRDEQDDGIPINKYRFSQDATVGGLETARNAAGSNPVDVTRVSSTQPIQAGRQVAETPNRRAGAVEIDDPMPVPPRMVSASTTQIRRGEGNVGLDEVGPEGQTSDAHVAVGGDDLSDLLPDALVAGRVAARRAPPPPRPSEDDEVAEVIAGWSTKRNWQKRVEEAIEFYADWPAAMEAICAIESPAVVKQIQSRLAQKS